MDPALRQELIGAVGRGWGHPENAHKTADPDLAMAVVEEVEAAFDRWAANAGHPPVPPDPGEGGNSDSGAVTRAEQVCETCRAFGPHPNDRQGNCRRHAPRLDPSEPSLGLWPLVLTTDFCCEWLPQPVAQTPLVETPP